MDGIIGGVGGVVVFLPNILLLFLAIAILEDSGYMARAAFIMDRFMHKIGLHGKSFIPMLIGFGCTVPAIMATRTLENERDRLTTMLVAPLMSCSARLPIYALIIPAFFPEAWHARMLWLIYFIGIVLAIICAKLLRSTLFKGETAPFVMELPPYRLPTVRGILVHTWERGWLYLKKAGTLILGVSIVMWALLTFPQETEYSRDYDQAIDAVSQQHLPAEEAAELIAELEQARASEELANSFAGRIGHAIEPLIKPLGFDWKIGTASIGAFAAKEVFVAQMGIVIHRRGRRGVRPFAGQAPDKLHSCRLLHHALQPDQRPLHGDDCSDQTREQFLEMGSVPARRADRAGIYHHPGRLPDRQCLGNRNLKGRKLKYD